jgi:thiol-disulfide isomerase/thioredoxin
MRIVIVVVVILAVALLVFGVRRERAAAPGGAGGAKTAAAPAPDFTLTDLAGTPVTLSSFRGKVVLLDFWATWCPPCRASLPHTQKTSLSAEAKAGDLVVLAINAQESKATVAGFLKSNGYTFRTLLDPKGDAFGKYGVQGIPTFVVINRDGSKAWQTTGFDAKTMDDEVAKALGK